jgi:Flp pilus assembly pilin Flp
MKKFRKGQSTLEYVIILAAVVAAIIAIGGMLQTKLGGNEGVYKKVSTGMQEKISGVDFN